MALSERTTQVQRESVEEEEEGWGNAAQDDLLEDYDFPGHGGEEEKKKERREQEEEEEEGEVRRGRKEYLELGDYDPQEVLPVHRSSDRKGNGSVSSRKRRIIRIEKQLKSAD